jgi:hypothetical protein
MRIRYRHAAALITVSSLTMGIGVSVVGARTVGKSLPTKAVEVGAVTVEATPNRIDAGGARIEIVLDTHETELDINLRRESKLTVDGLRWRTTDYEGDGPGGHHREGVLTFRARGPARGLVRLVIAGFDRPARLRWRLR